MERETKFWVPYRSRDTDYTGVLGPFQSWDTANAARKSFIADNERYFEVDIPMSAPNEVEAERTASRMSRNA